MPEHLWWYLSRASGIVCLMASGGAIVWGLMLSTRVIRRRSLPKWLLDLHRFLGTITVTALAVHLSALVADGYTDFGIADLAVPLHSEWRPVAVAWGVVGAYLLIAVQVTSLLMKRLPRRVWKWIHWSSAVAFIISLVHAASAGSDTSNRVYVVVAFVLSTAIVFLALVRVIAARSPEPRRQRTPRTTAATPSS